MSIPAAQEKKSFSEWFPTRPAEIPGFIRDIRLYLENMARLRHLRNTHAGRRCFILGNGPSLRLMNLQPLRNEFTFGLNRIYLLFETLGFSTTYLVAMNRLVLEQFQKEITALPGTKFVNWFHRDIVTRTPSTLFIRPGFESRFSRNPVYHGTWEGATVTFVAMQLAYFMGFSKVILIGVDHSFHTTGIPHQAIISEGDDPNHFDLHYFGKGIRWQLPDLETSEFAYGLARDAFRADGREILDATVGGKLNVFPKVDYEEILRMTR